MLNDKELREGECVSCDICEASFHISCLQPPLCSIPENGWICGLCRGLPTQERWIDEGSLGDSISTEFDCTIQNVSLCGYGPLRPIAGTGSNSYDYKDLFDPTLINPVFFGTIPQTADKDSWSEMPLTARLRRMAILLASESPSEMTVSQRLMIAQSIVEIARDVPDVIQFMGLSETATEKVYAEKEKTDQIHVSRIRDLCLMMNDSMRKKRSHDGGGEETESGMTGKENEAGKNDGMMEVENHEEVEIGKEEVTDEGKVEVMGMEVEETISEKGVTAELPKDEMTVVPKDEATVQNDEAGTQNVTDSETVSSQPNIKEAEENVNKPSRPRGWTDDEVKTLREAVKQIGEGKWTKIVALYGAKLGHRSAPGRICSSS